MLGALPSCPPTWSSDIVTTYPHLLHFDGPSCFTVEQLLEETDLTVCVFTGQLDLIVDTPGKLRLNKDESSTSH
jgi:hypothetical protein